MSLDLLARKLKEDARNRELRRCQSDLYYLCAEVLEYKWNPSKQTGLTETFHRSLCERMDRLREHPRVFTASHRGSLKTTCLTIALGIQEILRDPDVTMLIPHAVEDEAAKIVNEIVNHFKMNKRLRSLRPEIMPAPNGKWWWGANKMTVRGRKYSRQPTVLGVGAGSEITGAHVDVILADDIIGRRTIENSELPKIKSWWQNTALPVLNPAGRIRVVGTRWHPDDIYADFLADPESWDVLIRACSEIDGAADYSLQNPTFYGPDPGDKERAIKRLERLRKEMGGDFPAQMMNDPSPASEKPWDASKCEHFISMKEMTSVKRGTRFVVGDPAPSKVGSLDLTGARLRADGTKDEWAWQVGEIRANKHRQETIWLDGSASRAWTKDAGFDEGCRLAKKWGTPFIAVESVGQAIALYEEDIRKSARRAGIGLTLIKLKNTYKGKNDQFGTLASRAERDEFLILDTIDEAHLKTTLGQCREWRPLESGRNSLRYDDRANALSFLMDPALQEYAPQALAYEDPIEMWEEEFTRGVVRSRYCGV